ncbi:MAG: type VI secretion system protein TssA [Holosporaceae bacterium]|jgi:type VI secretion system protein ImpA|nr:type VI secretion system protein TssA [Holosporaceae bacterium]
MIKIEIEKLLLPISENSECGENLKYDYVFDQIKELRREDDPRLSQGIWQTELKKADWLSVDRVCTDLLKTKSKDLQIAVWLLESWTVMQKFHGFNHGILLLLALMEKFWDDIYPLIDWENHSFIPRLAPFYFLAEKLREKIVLIPIVESPDASPNYTLSDWITARHNLKIKNSNGLSLREIRKSVLSTPLEFFQNLVDEVTKALDNLKKLDDFIVEKCGNDTSPSFRGIIDCLEDIKRTTSKNIEDKEKQIAAQKPREQPHQYQSEERAAEEQSSSLSAESNSQEPTLDQAYAALAEIAVFLEKQQPQSPASTLVRIAAALGKKNFQELLEVNMKSGTSVINTISELYRVLSCFVVILLS